MKRVTYKFDNSESSDQTRDEVLAENAKKGIKIINEILEDCAKANIKVEFSVVPTNNVRQNEKIRLNKIYKEL